MHMILIMCTFSPVCLERDNEREKEGREGLAVGMRPIDQCLAFTREAHFRHLLVFVRCSLLVIRRMQINVSIDHGNVSQQRNLT